MSSGSRSISTGSTPRQQLLIERAMLAGFLCAFAAGGFWSCSGIINSLSARFKLDVRSYLLVNVLFTAMICAVFTVRWTVFFTATTAFSALFMLPAGIFNACGALTLQRALRTGNHAAVFLISQSAMVFPFLSAVLFFGENLSAKSIGGVLLIFAGMLTSAVPELRLRERSADRRWLIYALGAFVTLGISQTLMSLPSHWNHCGDSAHARTFLVYCGGSLLLLLSVIFPGEEKFRFSKMLAVGGGVTGIFNAISMALIFKALDILSSHNLAGLVFSCAIAASLVLFWIYAVLTIKEKRSLWQFCGILLTASGGILTSL